MKKFVCFMLAAALLVFGGCTKDKGDSQALKDELNAAVDKVNAEARVSGEYMLELTFGDRATLYYANGEVNFDRESKIADMTFSQTYLGNSHSMENYFSNGKMVSIEDGYAIEVERNPDELFGKFPYFPLPHGEGEITTATNSSGKAYSFEIGDVKLLCESLLGGDIYHLVTDIKKPQRDKTQYSNGKAIYTVADGNLVSARYEFDVKLFDTPAYIPGGSQEESKYTLDIHVAARVKYNRFGEMVWIEEYATADEE